MRLTPKGTFPKILLALLLASPAFAFAAANTLQGLLETATGILLLATPYAAALLYFFWNLAELLFTLDDAEKKKQARTRVIFGIIALFVLFTVGGLVAVFQRSIFGSTTGGGSAAPVVQQQGNPFGNGTATGNNSGGQNPQTQQNPPGTNPFNPPPATGGATTPI